MKKFTAAADIMEIRPYQLMCLICRNGCRNAGETYYHAERLNQIQSAISGNPLKPMTLRCNVSSVFRYQNPGREFDTPEGDLYNDLRDLTVLQRIGVAAGDTRPALDLLESIYANIPASNGVCVYPAAEAPNWPGCRLADSGNYERGAAKGIGTLIKLRPPDELSTVKRSSAEACRQAKRLRIRPHHLLCMTCFHAGRLRDEITPIPADNLAECIEAVQCNPDLPIELIQGPCMICPPCSLLQPESNLCVGGKGMGLRDEKKDLDTLRRLGLRYGDVLPARELFQRVFRAVHATTEVCGFGDGIERGREWRVCGGPSGKEQFVKARQSGLGIAQGSDNG